MANLAIRNLTIHPLELIRVQRFGCKTVKRQGSVTTRISNLLNATASPNHEMHPTGAPLRDDPVSFHAPPFQTTQTDVRPADAGSQVLRLTFRTEHHRYETDVPGPSARSSPMRKLDDDDDDDGPHDLPTAIYLPGAALLAVLPSVKLHVWMRPLHDAWPLTLLSIPGTHNSPTHHRALPSVRCQAVPVPDQLRNGIRFLDVRVSANPADDVLTLVHGVFPVSLSGTKHLPHLLDQIYTFLDQNPSETVLVSLKREGTGKATDGQMARSLKTGCVDKRPGSWWTHPRVPTLGEARGRIVLVRRFDLDDDMREDCGGGFGVDAHAWPDNCEDGVGGTTGGFRIQDFYDIDESRNIEKKVEYIRGQLERAAEQSFAHAGMPGHGPEACHPPFFVNFLSASNFFHATCWPERIAAKVNPAVIEYLCGRHGDDGKGPLQLKVGCAGTGVVVTDWVGANGDWDLVKCIVGMNARLQTRME